MPAAAAVLLALAPPTASYEFYEGVRGVNSKSYAEGEV